MDELRKRKSIRLKNANYSDVGTYFITICTEDRKCILSKIINPTDVPQNPQNVGTGDEIQIITNHEQNFEEIL